MQEEIARRFTKTRLGIVLVCLSTLAVNILAQKPDCRPPKPTLDGVWQDDLNRQKVTISTGSFRINAPYSTPNKVCRNPDHDGKTVPFQMDFDGDFTGSGIEGSIYWCDTFTKDGKTYTTGVGTGSIHLHVGKDGNTLSGTFQGRNGTESISFTNISKEKEFKQVVVHVTAGAKIYQEPSTTSRIRYTPAAGTKVIIEHAEVDANGNPTWYAVSNGEGHLGGVGGPNSGWIPAGKVRCNAPPGPVSQTFMSVPRAVATGLASLDGGMGGGKGMGM